MGVGLSGGTHIVTGGWTGRCDLGGCSGGTPHVVAIAVCEAGICHFNRFVEAVRRSVALVDLYAATMAMHVAEAADVHEYVKAELVACRERARQFVMFPAMTQPEVDDLASTGLVQRSDSVPQLPIGIVAMRVKQRCRQLDLQRIVVEEVDDWCFVDRRIFHQPSGSICQLG